MNFLIIVLLTALLFSCGNNVRSDKIVLAAPFGPLVYPLLRMVDDDGSPDGRYELKIWKTPDQLRAMIAGGQADFIAMPSNAAAVLHNKGVDISLVGVSLWRVLYIISTDSGKDSIDDFRGEKILMPFRGDMPHIVFANLAEAHDIDPERDLELSYVSTPLDAVQQLISGRASNAMLSEPDISILMRKAPEYDANRQFYRVVDIEAAWRLSHGADTSLPFGGIAALSTVTDNPAAVQQFTGDYKRAVDWCAANPIKTAELVTQRFEGISAEAVADAMKHIDLHFVLASEARPALETFYSVLLNGNPASIGGALPGDDFWGIASF